MDFIQHYTPAVNRKIVVDDGRCGHRHVALVRGDDEDVQEHTETEDDVRCHQNGEMRELESHYGPLGCYVNDYA